MPETVAVTLHPFHGHFAAFGYCVTVDPLPGTNSSHTVCDEVLRGRLPQRNALGTSNTILSFMPCRGSRKEGKWISRGHTQSWTSLLRCGSQLMFCLLPRSQFFLPRREKALFRAYQSNPHLSYGQRSRSFPGKLGPQANPSYIGFLWSWIICDSYEASLPSAHEGHLGDDGIYFSNVTRTVKRVVSLFCRRTSEYL